MQDSELSMNPATSVVPTIYPSPALDFNCDQVLTHEQVLQWREEGCALVNGIFPKELVEQVRHAAISVYPDGSGPMRDDFGSGGVMCFPCVRDDLLVVNEIPLHMRLIKAVHQLLETTNDGIRLTQCDLWGKRGSEETEYSRFCNSNQRIHCDYPNHTLVVPPQWDRPEVVSIIVYYDDSSAVGGETRVVPREGKHDPAYHSSSAAVNPLLLTPGARGDILWVNDKEHAESYLKAEFHDVYLFRQQHLYPREKKIGFETGSVLFYRHDIWHRYCTLSAHAQI